MVECLHHIVEIGVRGILDVLTLPVGESVHKEKLDATLDEWISSAISKLVPAVGRSNQGLGK